MGSLGKILIQNKSVNFYFKSFKNKSVLEGILKFFGKDKTRVHFYRFRGIWLGGSFGLGEKYF